MDKEPYFAPSADTLAEVKALTLREEAKLMAQAGPEEVRKAITDYPKRVEQMLKAKGYPKYKPIQPAELTVARLVSWRDEGGLSSKVPKPPEGRGLL